MQALIFAMVALVALLHLCFLVLEIFFWEKPAGLRIFGIEPAFAKSTRALAANQGLYNGFLAAGLIWGLYLGMEGLAIQIFFLVCVLIAGIFGALTVHLKIIYIQAFPALITLLLIYTAHMT